MNHNKAIIYDIETIVDVPKELTKEYEKYMENSKSGFVAYPPFNKIVCIAWLNLGYDRTNNLWKPSLKNGIIDKGYISGSDEKDIVTKFVTMLNKEQYSKFIGYNIKAFDNPMITWKAYQNKLTIPSYITESYKYSLTPVFDIKLALNNFDLFPLSMRTACISLGLPDPKKNGDGNDVAALYAARNYDAIGKYCLEEDVIGNYELFKIISRYKL